MQDLDLSAILLNAIKACRAGREVLLDYFGKLKAVDEKFQAGLVSEADKTAESVIFNNLRLNYPDFEYLGEETQFSRNDRGLMVSGQKPRWILDPLDGTTNYVHTFPIFCISLALEVNGQIQVAVIDVPMLNEVYTAIHGKGAKLNGRKIEVSRTETLEKSLLATGFFADHADNLALQLQIFSDLVRCTRGIRRPGAAAYDLCMVARGSFDGFWEKNLSPWDTAAGYLLVEEAGGVVTDYTGGKYNPYQNSIVASNQKIAGALLQKVKRHISI